MKYKRTVKDGWPKEGSRTTWWRWKHSPITLKHGRLFERGRTDHFNSEVDEYITKQICKNFSMNPNGKVISSSYVSMTGIEIPLSLCIYSRRVMVLLGNVVLTQLLLFSIRIITNSNTINDNGVAYRIPRIVRHDWTVVCQYHTAVHHCVLQDSVLLLDI